MARLGEFIEEYSIRNKQDEDIPVYSVTNDRGFCTNYFSKNVASEDRSTYKIVPKGYFAYNPSRINVGSIDWQNCEDRVIVSPLYVVFGISDKLDRQYLLHYLKSEIGQFYISEFVEGSVRDSLKFSGLVKIPIPLCSLENQKHIAAVLDRVSTLIYIRKKQLARLDELIKARFVEMFGAYSQNAVKAETFMYEMRNGLSPSSSGRYYEKVLTLSAITQGSFDETAWKDGCFEDCPPDDKRICATDFYICRGNGNKSLVGTGVYSPKDHFELIFPDTVIAARINAEIVRLPYLYVAWQMPNVREQIEKNARTTNGTYKINQQVISNIELVIPPLSIQDEFSEFIQQSDNSKLTIRQSLDKLEVLKKSLMQEYFG